MKRTWDKMCDMLKKQVKEIERLRKEKEWLIHRCALERRPSIFNTITSDEDIIIEEMQQALKEK